MLPVIRARRGLRTHIGLFGSKQAPHSLMGDPKDLMGDPKDHDGFVVSEPTEIVQALVNLKNVAWVG